MKVELVTGGRKYKGWENISIYKSIRSIAHTFSMDIFKGDVVNIQDDDLISILVDDKVFFNGYLDDDTLTISDDRKPLKINGRSKACDLIDCNILQNKQYNKLNIKQIMTDLVSPFNITVFSTLTLEALEVFDTKVGETYFNAINRLCKQTNTLPISDNNGNIHIIKNSNIKYPIILKDSDFKSITYPRRRSNRFSTYTYKKEAMSTDVTDATIKDDTVKRFRPFVGINTEDKTNIDLARWKKNVNLAESIQLNVEVYGWDLEINTIVKVKTEIIDASFLVQDVLYTKSNEGTISKATFISKDLYV